MRGKVVIPYRVGTLQLPDLDIPEKAFVLMIGDHNMPIHLLPKIFRILELALGDTGREFGALQFVFEDKLTVQPVLDVHSLDHNFGMIPIAGLL